MDQNILFEVFYSSAEILAGVKKATALQQCCYTDDPGNKEGPEHDCINYQDLAKVQQSGNHCFKTSKKFLLKPQTCFSLQRSCFPLYSV